MRGRPPIRKSRCLRDGPRSSLPVAGTSADTDREIQVCAIPNERLFISFPPVFPALHLSLRILFVRGRELN